MDNRYSGPNRTMQNLLPNLGSFPLPPPHQESPNSSLSAGDGCWKTLHALLSSHLHTSAEGSLLRNICRLLHLLPAGTALQPRLQLTD